MRERRKGITVLPVLLAFLSIASVLAVLQARALAQLRVTARLVAAEREALDRRALQALLTGQIGRAMMAEDGPVPDGTPFVVGFDGRNWEVRLQDVEGLVDLYLSPPEVLRAAGLDAPRIEAAREALAESQPLGRLTSLPQSLAYMGIPPALSGRVTQAAQSGGLRAATVPEDLRAALRALPEPQRLTGQVTRVTVGLRPLP